jgi:hypothetical protein
LLYFKADIKDNGTFGYLPFDFVNGYENAEEKTVYFQLSKDVKIPKYAELTEITKEAFEIKVSELTALDQQKRLEEQQAIIEQLNAEKQRKENEMNLLKSDLTLAKNDSISNMLAITELYEMILGGTA